MKGGCGRISATGANAVIFAFALALGTAILVVPRPVAPGETPGLRLDPAAIADVRGRDARLALEAPEGEPANTLRSRYADYSRGEVRGADTAQSARQRMGLLALEARRFREAAGEDAVAALRAEAVKRLDVALSGELDDAERDGLLGTFVDVLTRYEAAEDGRVVAPAFVVRTLFVARWNAAHGYEPAFGMSDVERQAYWGWLALSVPSAPPERRLSALAGYERAGGSRGEEARGTLLFQSGRMLEAAEAFERAYEEDGTLRLRNHMLAALAAAATIP